MAKRKPSGAFYCHHCGGILITVSDKQQFLAVPTSTIDTSARPFRRVWKTRLHAGVRCHRCGHEWWSRHPVALEVSRAKDARNAHPRRRTVPNGRGETLVFPESA